MSFCANVWQGMPGAQTRNPEMVRSAKVFEILRLTRRMTGWADCPLLMMSMDGWGFRRPLTTFAAQPPSWPTYGFVRAYRRWVRPPRNRGLDTRRRALRAERYSTDGLPDRQFTAYLL